MKLPKQLPKQWRYMNEQDGCCNVASNLRQGRDNDGTRVDGAWTCSVCGKIWIGNGEDEYLKHPLETLTEFGMEFMSAMSDVIIEGKEPRLACILGRMYFKDQTKFGNLMGI